MKIRSNIFKPLEEIPNTILTIVDSVKPDSWSRVLCRCQCGIEVVLTYAQVYYASKYSCGCTVRPRSILRDYTGHKVYSPKGRGRTLVILYRDPETGLWAYVCDCCAKVSLLREGSGRGVEHSLATAAAQDCPYYLEFVPVERIERISVPLHDGRVIPRITKAKEYAGDIPYRDKYRNDGIFAVRFPPERVVRDSFGEILGFLGDPIPHWLDRERRERNHRLEVEYRKAAADHSARYAARYAQPDPPGERLGPLPVPEDPEGFSAVIANLEADLESSAGKPGVESKAAKV
jgi:hypothetical protein